MKSFHLAVCITSMVLSAPFALGEPSRDTDLRPADPRENPPALSERAKGAEATLPIVIQRSINGDPELRNQDIRVAGNERRNITLSGYVSTPRLKRRAERLAEKVGGVQHVHNRIVVLGTEDVEGALDAPLDASDPLQEMPERE